MIFNSPTGMSPYWFLGEVVNKDDPTNNGRVKVRVFGLHPENPPNSDGDKEEKNIVEDQDLPWAICVSGTYGKMNMVPDEGDWVFGFMADGRDAQHPFLIGVIPGSNLNDMNTPVSPGTEAGPSVTGNRQGPLAPAPNTVGDEYPLSQAEIEEIVREEAELRGIDPDTAVAIYRSEGAGAYQSTVPRTGNGSLNGREASFGPYQLYTGGGLGNEYERLTGRTLTQDNSVEGITNQIRFALDRAATGGWGPWYGRLTAGVGTRDGLDGASPIGNWN
jgi:hypothetical protein